MTYEPQYGTFRPTFRAVYEQYAERDGQPFEFVREASEDERDDRGPMYHVRFSDGTEIVGWPEEVCVDLVPPTDA